MGNLLSSRNGKYESNPQYVICDANKLTRQLLNHRESPLINEILEEIPVAINYIFYSLNMDGDVVPLKKNYNAISFGEYKPCDKPLCHQLSAKSFAGGCRIVLTKAHHAKIVQLKKYDKNVICSCNEND